MCNAVVLFQASLYPLTAGSLTLDSYPQGMYRIRQEVQLTGQYMVIHFGWYNSIYFHCSIPPLFCRQNNIESHATYILTNIDSVVVICRLILSVKDKKKLQRKTRDNTKVKATTMPFDLFSILGFGCFLLPNRRNGKVRGVVGKEKRKGQKKDQTNDQTLELT